MLFAEEVAAGSSVTWPVVVQGFILAVAGVIGVWMNWRLGRERQVLTDRAEKTEQEKQVLNDRVEKTERKVRVLRKKHVRSQQQAAEQHAECEKRFAQLEAQHDEQKKFERKRAHDYKELAYALGDKLGLDHDTLVALIRKYVPDATPGRPFAIYLPGRDKMPGAVPHLPPPSPPPSPDGGTS